MSENLCVFDAHEKGFYVRVPVDYFRPERGMTEVYSYFHRGFDPSKETMIYFTGGPGQTSHWGLFRNPMPYNVLIMEHRGIGCSRPDTWMSRQARMQLMYNDGVKKLKERLEFLTDEKVFKEFLTEVRKSYEPITYTPHVLFASNDIAYMMISCQELGMANPEVSIEDSFIKGQLVRKVDTDSIKQCARLRAKGDKIYRAENYPVKVPVTYFQGSDDGATAAPEGIRHYKNVPLGFKQLAILVRGGHNPNLELILYENPQQLQIFDYAMKGLPIPKSLCSEMKKNTGHFWAYTSSEEKKESPPSF